MSAIGLGGCAFGSVGCSEIGSKTINYSLNYSFNYSRLLLYSVLNYLQNPIFAKLGENQLYFNLIIKLSPNGSGKS